MWLKPHSHKEHVRLFQLHAYICHTQDFFTSLSLNKCPFQLQCPLSNLVIILSWFLLRLSTSPAFSQMVFCEIP